MPSTHREIYRVSFAECPAQRACSTAAKHLARPYECLNTGLHRTISILTAIHHPSYKVNFVLNSRRILVPHHCSTSTNQWRAFPIHESRYSSRRRNRTWPTSSWLRQPQDSNQRTLSFSTALATALRK